MNTLLLWCDLGRRVLGAKTAVPGHPGTALAGPALQGHPLVLGSAWVSWRAQAPPATAGRKASSELLHTRAKHCHHRQGVLAPSCSRALRVQMWIHTPTHLHVLVLTHAEQMLCCGQRWPFCSAFSSGCPAGCRQPISRENLGSLVCSGGTDLTPVVHYDVAELVPLRSERLSRVFLIA